MSFVHSPKIVTDGLVLALDAGNTKSYTSGSTTWYDKSGNGYNETLINGPTFSSANGGSIVFDGTNDYAQYSSRSLNTEFQYSSSFTIEVVAKIMENTSYGYLINNRALTDGNGTPYAGWGLLQGEGILIGFIGGYPSSTYDWRNTNISTTDYTNAVFGKWAHIVWTNGGTLNDGKIYLNGNNATSQSYDNNTPPYVINYNGNQKITLGMSPADGGGSGDWFLSGSISCARVYNRALSAPEIQQNFNALRGRYGI